MTYYYAFECPEPSPTPSPTPEPTPSPSPSPSPIGGCPTNLSESSQYSGQEIDDNFPGDCSSPPEIEILYWWKDHLDGSNAFKIAATMIWKGGYWLEEETDLEWISLGEHYEYLQVYWEGTEEDYYQPALGYESLVSNCDC